KSLDISNLPSDIIRKIIRVGQESIDNMRMISPRWNQIALEHLNVSHHLPVIKMFSIREILPARFGWSLYIRIPRHYSTYFGVDRWDIITEFSDGEPIEFVKRISHWPKRLKTRISRLFARCSRIERFYVDNIFNFEVIRRRMDYIIIHELRFLDLKSLD
ncbi:hypothetical protein PENTCL1PPCAC_7815, partial [Pristionchus entomophagus]